MRKTHKKTTVSDLVMFFAFATAIFFWGRHVNNNIRWMHDHGQPATGRVTAITPVFKTQVNIAVEYVTTDGTPELASLSWYESARLGERIEILYNPYDHQSIMLASTNGNYILYVISAILFFFGILGTFEVAQGQRKEGGFHAHSN